MSDKRVFALIFRIWGFAIGLSGIILQTAFGGGFMGASSLTFFTIQTNIFTTALFLALAIKTSLQIKTQGAKGVVAHFNPNFQLALTFYITITFVIYWTMLSWQQYSADGVSDAILEASNYLLHGVTPVLAMLDALLFMPHGKIKKIQSVWWLVYPLLYLFFVVIRAETGGPLYSMSFGGKTVEMYYPYFFIEHQIVGTGGLIGIVFGVCFIFWLFALLFIFVDRKCGEYYLRKFKPEYYYIERV